jgi:hypothetical protein
MDILSKFSLPSYLKGKSFSEASKAIQERFKGRTDPESMATMSELMERLMSAQEFVKKQEEAMRDQVSEDESQMQGQGDMPVSNDPMQQDPVMQQDPRMQQQSEQERAQMMDPMYQTNPIKQEMFGQMPQEQMMQEQANANQFNDGGFANSTFGKGFQEGATGGEIMGTIGSGIKGIADITGSVQQMFGGHGLDTSGAVVDERPDITGGVVGGLADLGKGFATGNPIDMVSGGLKAIGSIVGGNKANKAIDEQQRNNALMRHNDLSNDYGSSIKRNGGKLEQNSSYKYGGSLEKSSSYKHGGSLEKSSSYMKGGKMLANMYHDGGGVSHNHRLYNGITQNQIEPFMNEARKITGIKDFDATNPDHVKVLQTNLLKPNEDVNPLFISGQEGSFINDGGKNSVNNKGVDGLFGTDTFRALKQVGSLAPKAKGLDTTVAPPLVPRRNTENESIDRGKASLLEGLRYAPAAMNALQLAQLKKPDQVGLNRLNNRYIPQRVDERGIQNTVQDSISNNRDAILNSSGGSGSAARANLLASQKVGGDAMSKAYMQATEMNRQDNRVGQQFNLGVDQINLSQANQETGLNLEQQAAYRTNKSKLMSQLGNDLGNVGREEMFKRYPEMMGLDYRWRGNYNPTGMNTTTNTTTSSAGRSRRGLVQNQNEDPTVTGINPTVTDAAAGNEVDNPIFNQIVTSKTGTSGYNNLDYFPNINKKGGSLSRMSSLDDMLTDPISKIFPKKKKKKSVKKATKKRY